MISLPKWFTNLFSKPAKMSELVEARDHLAKALVLVDMAINTNSITIEEYDELMTTIENAWDSACSYDAEELL